MTRSRNTSAAASSSALAGSSQASRRGALGRDGGSVVRPKAEQHPRPWQARRREVWDLQRVAARLLYPAGTPQAQVKGVGTCRWAMQNAAAGVGVRLSTYAETGQVRASFSGLQTCGLVWACPACAARISEERRRELNDLLAWARAQGHQVIMVTLTARHGLEDELDDLLANMKEAKRVLRQRRDWRVLKLGIVGTVTATEVTRGHRHGWHVHFHEIVVVRAGTSAEAVALFEPMGDAWRASLRGRGLDGAGAAWQVQGASAAGSYLAKWGAAEELALSGRKRGRDGGLTPLQLLAAVRDGDREAEALWLEYHAAFRGRRQLVWSPGLKEAVGIIVKEDAEAAVDEVQEGQEAEPDLLKLDAPTWRRRGRWRRNDVLDAAEDRGADGVWSVIDGEVPDPEAARQLADAERVIEIEPEVWDAVDADIERWMSRGLTSPSGMPEDPCVS